MRGILAAGIVTLAAVPSSATERACALRDMTVLEDGRGQARLLFRMEDVVPVGDVVVADAKLRVPLSGVAAERGLRLRVHPVTSDWTTGSVSWTAGWSRPGGDFDEDVFVAAEVDLRRGMAMLDLTPLVKESVEEGRATHGFLLTLDPADGTGLALADASRFEGLGGASVAVSYLRVGGPPRRP